MHIQCNILSLTPAVVMPKDKLKNDKMYNMILHKHGSVLLSLLKGQNSQKLYFILSKIV